MHEASLVQGLLQVVEKALDGFAAANPGAPRPRVAEIVCEAGLLACFEKEALAACFEIFVEGTPLEKARLAIKTAPLDCVCRECGSGFQLLERKFACPACGSANIDFKGGNGLVLLSLKLEEEANG